MLQKKNISFQTILACGFILPNSSSYVLRHKELFEESILEAKLRLNLNEDEVTIFRDDALRISRETVLSPIEVINNILFTADILKGMSDGDD